MTVTAPGVKPVMPWTFMESCPLIITGALSVTIDAYALIPAEVDIVIPPAVDNTNISLPPAPMLTRSGPCKTDHAPQFWFASYATIPAPNPPAPSHIAPLVWSPGAAEVRHSLPVPPVTGVPIKPMAYELAGAA
ncbi:hypothetical protein AWB75_01642 [Caballeronia catudaia]|uniref:Uncharacterized protein n=1 Tax=Caballeronia catudaia TaxID=1777136 RepID=A0A158A1V8_9BURK|nr:hypothetical protein [Caballeronia catudaia]SAK51801.1 hypothetical protein AWB75_01642 [Caballeronia catudaia]